MQFLKEGVQTVVVLHTMLLRMVHEGLAMASLWLDDIVLGVNVFSLECVPKASPNVMKNQLNKFGLSIDIISHV